MALYVIDGCCFSLGCGGVQLVQLLGVVLSKEYLESVIESEAELQVTWVDG